MYIPERRTIRARTNEEEQMQCKTGTRSTARTRPVDAWVGRRSP